MRTRMLRRAETENRVDDTIEIHAKRLRDFSEQGPQVIDFYEGEGVYQKVDCERDFEVVYQELVKFLSCSIGLRYIDRNSPSSVFPMPEHKRHEPVEEGLF